MVSHKSARGESKFVVRQNCSDIRHVIIASRNGIPSGEGEGGEVPGRRPNGFLGPSLNDRTILFLVMLLDKTVSVIKDSPCIRTLAFHRVIDGGLKIISLAHYANQEWRRALQINGGSLGRRCG